MPHAAGLPSAYSRTDNTGDGILMGYWIGGTIQLAPHAGNIHYDPPVNYPDVSGSGQPWLSVNQLGERFANEDVVYGQIYAQDMNQPGLMHWQIFDGDFKSQCGTIGSGMMRTEPFPDYGDAIEASADAGDCYRADTIEDLADQIGVPVDTFKATIDRYNELYEKGVDEDFGKKAEYLTPIKTAPFYAVARQAGILCTLNGLLTDDDMHVVDADNNVIPNLYAVGNCQGGWFGGLEHQMMIPGMSLGRAATTGRVAAKRACGIED
jgi:fumarate reductase flavoprotein subunit